MEKILDRMEALLGSLKAFKPLAALKAARAQAADACCRIGVTGAFSRGKTHLINQLLDADILPEDILPSTTVLTEIFWSPELLAEFIGERREALAASQDSLALFAAGGARADAEGVLRIGAPCGFLKPNLLLYDTPGIDDLLEARADISFEALRFCDAALILVSAVAPLGIHERQFAEEFVRARNKPRLAFVVSFLDQLDERHRPRQLEHIRESVKRLCPQAQIWSAAPGLPKELCEASGIPAMREKIRLWADDPAIARAKKELLGREAALLLRALIEIEEERLAALKQEGAEEGKRLAAERRKLRDQEEDWADLRARFLEAGLINADKLQESARKAAEQAGGEGRRQDLREITSMLAGQAQKNYQEDVESFLAEIREKYGLSLDFGRGVEFLAADAGDWGGADSSMGGEPARLLLTLAERHAEDLIIRLPLPPMGKMIIRELARRLLIAARKKYDNPRAREAALAALLSSAARDLRAMLQESYAQAAAKIQSAGELWLKEQGGGMEFDKGGEGLKDKIRACGENIAALSGLLGDLSGGAGLK